MKNKSSGALHFAVDLELINSDKAIFLIQALEQKYSYDILKNFSDLETQAAQFFFMSKKNLKKVNHLKNKIVIVPKEDSLPSSMLSANLNSIEETTELLEKIHLAKLIALFRERANHCEILYEEMINLGKDRSTVAVTENELALYSSIVDLELFFLQEKSLEKWNEQFKSFCKKNNHVISIHLLEYEALGQYEDLIDESSLIFKLPFEDIFLCLNFKSFSLHRDAFFVEQLITIVTRALEAKDQKLVTGDGEIDLWKKVFSKIPYPMSLISDMGDLLIYNESFAKIGILPKECLRFKDLENTEIFQNFYKIRRIDFTISLLNISYFVFYSVEKNELPSSLENFKNAHASSDELGIISSSIAHELNNPLAGILAALSLLSLEDDWTSESLADLEDMKSGARRCKELVEIFLGFSRFSPSQKGQKLIKDSLDQAINLLRFRMIESNLRLDLKYVPTLEKFSHQINSSVMSMIFYLISSELMTAFAHHRLITMAQSGALRGEVLEFSNQIVFKLDEEFEYEEKIAQSKLIQHLLIFEKLELNFLSQEIRLIFRK